jgi:tungstate transport system permease protein
MLLDGICRGIEMLVSLDPSVWHPIGVSLQVSATSTLLALVTGLPLGLALGTLRFPGHRGVVVVLNTLLALPTVVVGLVVYALLSRSGALGGLSLLYTRTAMVIGQTVLVLPLVAALVNAAVEKADERISLTALGLGAGRAMAVLTVASERRPALIAAVGAGFGRVFSEVGVSMMLGGNIAGHTRNITTGIAFETGKGEFAVGIALGVVLLGVALALNLGAGLWLSSGADRA